jgi:hypothetical protein
MALELPEEINGKNLPQDNQPSPDPIQLSKNKCQNHREAV